MVPTVEYTYYCIHYNVYNVLTTVYNGLLVRILYLSIKLQSIKMQMLNEAHLRERERIEVQIKN